VAAGSVLGNATALNTQSSCPGALGRQNKALDTIKEAIGVRRKLAIAFPDPFLADLAESLATLGDVQTRLEDREGAIRADREALRLYIRHQVTSGHRCHGAAAEAINRLATDLSNLGLDETDIQQELERLT
jgi:tetratricopeptide (TPR) repeat protein